MVVIISSKVRTVAHCNYTCAAISVWKGMWVERCGKNYKKMVHFVCVCGCKFVCGCECMCVGCAVRQKREIEAVEI